MKIIAPVLLAILAAPLTMALDFSGSVRGGAMDKIQQRELGSYSTGTSGGKGKGSASKGKGGSKGSKGDDDDATGSKGGSKGSKGSKGGSYSSGDDRMEPKVESPPSEFYLDSSTPSPTFQLDPGCTTGSCVGTVVTFKNDLYYDEHLTEEAGFNIGFCKIVAEHPGEYEYDPSIQQLYCLFSVFVDHYGEIALAGVGTFDPAGSTFLITAASGAYACYTGSLLSVPTDETMKKYSYKFTFGNTDKCEPQPLPEKETPKYEPMETTKEPEATTMDGKYEHYTTTEAPEDPTTTMDARDEHYTTTGAPEDPTTTAPEALETIKKIIKGDEQFTQLVLLLEAAGLLTALAQPGMLTLFAPTDTAFENLGLPADTPIETIQSVLLYHVVNDEVDLLVGENYYMTLNGAEVLVTVTETTTMVNGANITGSIPASNGIVYVIDAVLLPPAPIDPTTGATEETTTMKSMKKSNGHNEDW